MKVSVKAKIIGTLTIVLILMTAVSIYITYSANKVMDKARDSQLELVEHVEDFREASTQLTVKMRGYATTGDIAYLNEYNDIIADKTREKALEAIKEIGMTDEALAIAETVMDISNELAEHEEEAKEYAKDGEYDKAMEVLYTSEYKKDVNGVNENIEKFETAVEESIKDKINRIDRFLSIFNVLMYVFISIVFLAQTYVVWFILHELIDPIVKVEKKMTEFSNGILGEKINLKENNSEIGRMVTAINKFQKFQKEIINDIDYLLTEMSVGNFVIETTCEENYIGDYENIILSLRKINRVLGDTLINVYQSAGQVDSAAGQVAAGAQALSQGATEQASSIQELSATINEISEKVKQNAGNTRNANDLSNESAQVIDMCKDKMREMVAAIEEISDSSQQISNIIKTIDDIAFQTNVLALNATVEAARAGSAGAGFAVVADEVRSLANKSAEAAKNTTDLIENSLLAVDNGTRLAADTSNALDEIVNKSELLNGGIEKIAEATNEQASAISQVTLGVEQISAVIQTNSATAEESAAASEELSGQAQVLKDLLSKFKLRDE